MTNSIRFHAYAVIDPDSMRETIYATLDMAIVNSRGGDLSISCLDSNGSVIAIYDIRSKEFEYVA